MADTNSLRVFSPLIGIAACLILSSARAAEKFDELGHSDSRFTSGNVRALTDWCNLASNAKSEGARKKYAATIQAIESQLEQVKRPLTPDEKAAIRQATLAIIKAGPLNARLTALTVILPVADESCLQAVVAVSTQSSPNIGLGENEIQQADAVIARIGGKKGISALVAMARAKVPVTDNSGGIERMVCIERCARAIESLGTMDTAEAEAALKSLQRHGRPAAGWDSNDAVARALKSVEENIAAKEDAKAAAHSRPGQFLSETPQRTSV